MEVKIQKLNEDAVTPKYESKGAAGMDLTATSKHYDEFGNVVYGTGLAIEIPEGFVGYIFPRSSNAKKELLLSNSVGVIDSDYRGEVIFKFKHSLRFPTLWTLIKLCFKKSGLKLNVFNESSDSYQVGDRIGQIIIMPYPKIEFIEVKELDKTERGNGGFGSTNK